MYDPSTNDKEDFLIRCKEHWDKKTQEGPLWVQLRFNMRRPNSHYRSGKYSHILKDDAPEYHVTKPDSDNLIKFVCDALNGVFYKDDSQITRIQAVKVYAKEPSTEITIMEDYKE